jgi:hypothetical protein
MGVSIKAIAAAIDRSKKRVNGIISESGIQKEGTIRYPRADYESSPHERDEMQQWQRSGERNRLTQKV